MPNLRGASPVGRDGGSRLYVTRAIGRRSPWWWYSVASCSAARWRCGSNEQTSTSTGRKIGQIKCTGCGTLRDRLSSCGSLRQGATQSDSASPSGVMLAKSCSAAA